MSRNKLSIFSMIFFNKLVLGNKPTCFCSATGTISNKLYRSWCIDSIVGPADDMGLQMKISKIKYMFSTRNKSQRNPTHSLSLGSRKFQVVKEFLYLGTQTNADKALSNNNSKTI